MEDPQEENLHRWVNNAVHDSVSTDTLTETRGLTALWLHDRPLWTYLNQGEQPHFIFYAKRLTPDFRGPDAPPDMTRSRPYRVMHMVTDQRWIMVAGNRNGDDVRTFSLDAIGAVNFDMEEGISKHITNREFIFESERETLWCRVPLANEFDYDDLAQLSQYLADNFEATQEGVAIDSDEAGYTVEGADSVEADRETIAILLDEVPPQAEEEANDLIAEAESATELATELNALIEEHRKESESVDDIINRAESYEELRREVETPVEELERKAHEQLSNVKGIARDADPSEVGRWGKGVAKTTLPLAIRAPYSTPYLVTASLIGGSAIGVYASGVNDTILNDIDPDELVQHTEAMIQRGAELENINGEVAGMLLGVSEYVGQQLAPEELAKWIVEADSEAVLEGAELGAALTLQNQVEGTRREGAIAGATLGLMHGYSQNTDDNVKNVLEEDIYKRYLEKLAEEDLSLPE